MRQVNVRKCSLIEESAIEIAFSLFRSFARDFTFHHHAAPPPHSKAFPVTTRLRPDYTWPLKEPYCGRVLMNEKEHIR